MTITAAWRDGLRPEPKLSLVEWCEKFRILPNTAARPGPFRVDATPYLRDILDDLSPSSGVERVVVAKSAQVGATELSLNFWAFVIAHAPGTGLSVLPSLDVARRLVRGRLDPMVSSMPCLRERVGKVGSKTASNTQTRKQFAGGSISFAGANSAASLRSEPCRYIVLDEVDAFPADLCEEGDPIVLAETRSITFGRKRKVLLISTPTLKGLSRIEAAYEEGDRRVYELPCPDCAGRFVPDFDMLDPAGLICPHCGVVIPESKKLWMLRNGAWKATAAGDGRTHSYWITGYLSPFTPWADLLREHQAVKHDPARLKAYVNTRLGLVYEDAIGRPVEALALQERAEESDYEWSDLLPDGAAVITAGADIQHNRIEVELVAWGRGEESWSIDYQVIHGDTSGPAPWEALDHLLLRRFRHPRAVPDLPVAAACVDAGDGGRMKQVMDFCGVRSGRRVFAIKGRGGPGVPLWPKRPPRVKPGCLAGLFIVGVDTAKETGLARLGKEEKTGPGVCHFPQSRDLDWYRGLVSEKPIRKWRNGVPRVEWVRDAGVRNEPVDCRAYALAGLQALHASGLKLPLACDAIGRAPIRPDPLKVEPEAPRPAAPRVTRSAWVESMLV